MHKILIDSNYIAEKDGEIKQWYIFCELAAVSWKM